MNQFWGRHISDDFVEWLSLFDSGSIPLDEWLDGMSLKRALYVFASFFQAAILILWGVGDFLEHPKNNQNGVSYDQKTRLFSFFYKGLKNLHSFLCCHFMMEKS